MKLIKQDNLKLMEFSLTMILNVHVDHKNGFSILHEAFLSGSIKTVELLTSRGANIHLNMAEGVPLLHPDMHSIFFDDKECSQSVLEVLITAAD